MQDEDKIFGLIAQAEDIQKHTVELQGIAEDTLKKLPDTARNAIKAAAEQCIGEEAKKASDGLLSALKEAKTVSSALRRTGLQLGVFLLAIALVIVGVGYFAGQRTIEKSLSDLESVLNRQIEIKQTALAGLQKQYEDERAKLKSQLASEIKAEQETLNVLQSKTWRLELRKSNNGRSIILPHNTYFDGTDTTQDGRVRINIY